MYSKTCLKGPLKKDKTKILMTNGSLMKIEREHSAILLTCIQRLIGLENHVLIFLRVAVLHRFYCLPYLPYIIGHIVCLI